MIRKCENCGKKFKVNLPNYHFCSWECNQAFHKPKVDYPRNNRYKKLKFQEVPDIHVVSLYQNLKNLPRRLQVKKCGNCGCMFQTIHGFQMYCSGKCKQQAYLRRMGIK